MKTSPLMASIATLMMLLGPTACGDKPAEGDGETGTAGETATESGTGDEIGDTGSTTTTTTTNTDTNTDTNSTTDTTDGCPIGSEGCPCTDGGGCDPGLVCDGGTCGTPTTDTTDTGTTDTGTTDTGTDTTTTDTGEPPPYQACPNGEGDCAPGEICVTGTANQGQLPWTMCTSGMCGGDNDCAVDDNDVCADLPGDGAPVDYCVPVICDMQNPCPDPMQCAVAFGGGNPSVCVWPD